MWTVVCNASPPQPRSDASCTKRLISNRKEALKWLGGALLCSCTPSLSMPMSSFAATMINNQSRSEWIYGSAEGTLHWEGTCAIGKSQSPIDLPFQPPSTSIPPSSSALTTELLKFSYPRFIKEGVTIVNNGHGSPQINFPKGCGEICVGDTQSKKFSLLQLHYHTPSEHSINGKHTPIECHIVHKNFDTDEIAVVAILLTTNDGAPEQGVLSTALHSAPTHPKTEVPLSRAISILSTLPRPVSGGAGGGNKQQRRRYATYVGSLTTPPCTEKVNWYILLDPVPVPTYQVLELMSFGSGGNTFEQSSRPIQSLNGRTIQFLV